MPEPYPFPPLPEGPFKPDTVLALTGGDITLKMTQPCAASNFISFIFHGNREVARWALVLDDNGKEVPIWEDGKVTSIKEIGILSFRIVLGAERFEKLLATGWQWK